MTRSETFSCRMDSSTMARDWQWTVYETRIHPARTPCLYASDLHNKDIQRPESPRYIATQPPTATALFGSHRGGRHPTLVANGYISCDLSSAGLPKSEGHYGHAVRTISDLMRMDHAATWQTGNVGMVRHLRLCGRTNGACAQGQPALKKQSFRTTVQRVRGMFGFRDSIPGGSASFPLFARRSARLWFVIGHGAFARERALAAGMRTRTTSNTSTLKILTQKGQRSSYVSHDDAPGSARNCGRAEELSRENQDTFTPAGSYAYTSKCTGRWQHDVQKRR